MSDYPDRELAGWTDEQVARHHHAAAIAYREALERDDAEALHPSFARGLEVARVNAERIGLEALRRGLA